MYLLGYDIGSSSIKAGLVEAATGRQVGLARYPDKEMAMMAPQSGWAEQEPEVWWQHLIAATHRLLQSTQVEPASIRAIGISYQMHGLVLVDKQKEVLRPAIIWCDSRAVSIGHTAFEDLGSEFCLSHLLNSPGNFTASKLKWVKDNEPAIYERIHKIMLPGDFIAMKLTAELNTTVSGLSEGVFWDFAEHKISEALLNYFDFDQALFPEIVESAALHGELSAEAANLTGLRQGTPVSFRAGDQPNNAMSLNVLNPGEIAATAGTSGVVYGVVDKPVFDPRSRVNGFAHINHSKEANRIGILLCINGAGRQWAWLREQISPAGLLDYAAMEAAAASTPVGSDGISVLPFGNGAERILGNRNLGSHWLGLEFNRHNLNHLYRAALEGIAFSFVYGMNIMKQMGIKVEVIKVDNGNMFRSPIMASTVASSLGCSIEVMDTTGAYGTARAAGVAIGEYENMEEAQQGIGLDYVVEPTPGKGLHEAYELWLSRLNKQMSED